MTHYYRGGSGRGFRGGGGYPQFPEGRGGRFQEGRRYMRAQRFGDNPKADSKGDFESGIQSSIIRIGDQSPSTSEQIQSDGGVRRSMLLILGKVLTHSIENNKRPFFSQLTKLVKAIENDLSKHEQVIVETIVKCAARLPFKGPIYGTLVGLLNENYYDLVENVVQACFTALQTSLDSGDHHSSKLLFRFLSSLAAASVINSASLLHLLEQLLSAAQESGTESGELLRTEWFLYLLLITLPWAAPVLHDEHSDQLTDLLDQCNSLMSRRIQEGEAPPSYLAVWESFPGQDQLIALWKSIQADELPWPCTVVQHPSTFFADQLNACLQHTPPELTLSYAKSYPPRRYYYAFLPPVDTDMGLNALDRFLLRDIVQDILLSFVESHKECAKQIQFLPLTGPKELSFFRLVFEVIFNQMFVMPSSPFPQMYYSCVFFDLMKAKKTSIPALLEAVDHLFERLDVMDVECCDRFCEWFSIHLSNFDYIWKWQNWEYVLSLPEGSQKTEFVRSTLERCMRLSYLERIQKAIPSEFAAMLPTKPDPVFAWDETDPDAEDREGFAMAKSLLEKLRRKAPAEQLLASLGEDAGDKPDSEELQLRIFVECLLHVGNKSISHLNSVIERNLAVLSSLVHGTALQQTLLSCVADYWRNSCLHLIVAIDRLLCYSVVENSVVVRWIFKQQALLSRGFIWEVLRMTINKTMARTIAIEVNLQSAESSDDGSKIDEAKKLRSQLETSLQAQKELVELVFQSFSEAISVYLLETGKDDMSSNWYHTVIGHLKEFARKYHGEIRSQLATLQMLFARVDQSVASMFSELQEMR